MQNASRRALLAGASGAVLTSGCASFFSPHSDTGDNELKRQARAAMKRAAQFMRERVAYRGGYVWSYAPDLSRRWGEMEAFPSMIWIQPPGTATVGHLYLDCFHATRDEFYYQAAMDVAEGLIAAQHPAGGWNYHHDFGGEESTRRWYDTIGKNGWRLEEFHHYYGNATFDDAGTSEASQFLLRMYVERRSSRLRAPLERAVSFVLDSQYENGGWPQRFPFVEDAPALHGRPDYTRYVTFNDDVAGENIKFLLMVYQTLGDERALAAIHRAMGVFIATQQPAPQAGWGLQHHNETLTPIGARSYEPDALTTHTTANNLAQMMNFYEWTGERRFIERVPEALAWLSSSDWAMIKFKSPGATIRHSSKLAPIARASITAVARMSSTASIIGTTTTPNRSLTTRNGAIWTLRRSVGATSCWLKPFPSRCDRRSCAALISVCRSTSRRRTSRFRI